MSLNQLISAILLSTTALTVAAAFDDSEESTLCIASFNDSEGSTLYIASFNDRYSFVENGQVFGTVFTRQVVRTEKDYQVYQTDNPLSHAFVPSSDVLVKWHDGVELLLETLRAGLEYSQSLIEDHPSEKIPAIRAADPDFLDRMIVRAVKIARYLQCGRYSLLPESLLNHLYLDIMSSIDEIQHNASPLLQHLVHTMYVPIRDWMKENFPVCSMYDYVRPQVTIVSGHQTRVDYFFEAERYFNGYLFQTEAYEKIRAFAEKKSSESSEFQLDLTGFVNSTYIELGEGQTCADPLMQYVRFLEGIKQREIAFVETWLSKVREEEAKLDACRAQSAAHELAEKARKARDPKAMAKEMMRAMGLDDDDLQKTAESKRKKAPKPKYAQAETAPAKSSKQAKPSVTGDVTPHLLEETSPVAVPAAAAEIPRVSEKERLANIAATEAENAARNRAQEDRQRMLEVRRASAVANEGMVFNALARRQGNWLENAFSARLSSFDPSQQISLEGLALNPDFDTVCGKLRSIGCYVDPNIHGNEKGIARWIGADGKNAMVWFDHPHGAQLKMGIAAGWFKSLVKRLRETGKLIS